MNNVLRKAEIKDISRIAEILIFVKRTTYRDIFKNDNVSFNIMQVLNEIERLKQPNEMDDIFVYEDEVLKAIIKLEFKDDKILISDFYVDTFFQNEGVGTKIIDSLKAQNKKLELYVLDKNINAIRFYEKKGFKDTNESKEFENSGFFMLKYAY